MEILMLFTFYQINFILSYVHPKYIENGNKNSTKKNKLQAKQIEILHIVHFKPHNFSLYISKMGLWSLSQRLKHIKIPETDLKIF